MNAEDTMIMPNDPLTDERWDHDAGVAAAATDAYEQSIAADDPGDVNYADRVAKAAGFLHDDLEDALERTREMSRDIEAAARTFIRNAPAVAMAVAFGLGCLLSRRRSRH